MRDKHRPDGKYVRNLLGAREVIPQMLSLFEEFGIACTWATVGFLFAENRDEINDFRPTKRPEYLRPELDPYPEDIGRDEREDPLHFAPSLIRRIADTPMQEVGSHTFSHYYCLQDGEDHEAFAADVASAVAIAERRGLKLESLVLPRNQINRSYLPFAREAGFLSYRGEQLGWIYSDVPGPSMQLRRATRLLDAYVGVRGPGLAAWDTLLVEAGLRNVRAGGFLRPYRSSIGRFEEVRIHHLLRSIRTAAREKKMLHLWWHPHNFGVDQGANLQMLRRLLEEFRRCRDELGMESLAMRDVARSVSETDPRLRRP